MSYTAEISRTNPSLIVILIDQSESMEDPLAGGELERSKAEGVAEAVNRLLQNLVIKCAKSEGIRDYYAVSVLGYSDRGIEPCLQGKLAGKSIVPISEIGNNPVRIEERLRSVETGEGTFSQKTVKVPVWVDPVSRGGTPMCRALRTAAGLVESWLSAHRQCFPPIVINITDGEPTDGNPLAEAAALKRLSSEDGNVLLFNLHISSTSDAAIEYPDSEDFLPDAHARRLFRMSSVLPDHMWLQLQADGLLLSEHPRGFVFNADAGSLVRFLEIGTRPKSMG